ncbi:MAG: tRNA (guanine(26)-N(2))-dimethyltransferase, partial [Halobacteria archaeon]|nr:tRNA (guanine(26)-N(2))-dimethyltransferase [Halobacteria archaeon]
EEAVENIRANLDRNDVDAEVSHEDANVFFHSRRFDVIDVDPFGSPFLSPTPASTRFVRWRA